MLKQLGLVMLLAGSAQADGAVFAVRLGVGHEKMTSRGADSGSTEPSLGFVAGLDGYYALGRIRFGLGYDHTVFGDQRSNFDLVSGMTYHFDETAHVISLSAKVMVDLVPKFVFAWGAIGAAGVLAGDSNLAARTELGVGFRIPLDQRDALRFDASWVNVSPWNQYAGTAGFEHYF